jgi:enoyl-CoA hydratase
MANYKGYKYNLVEKIPEKKIVVVTLNQPEKRNPGGFEVYGELRRLWAEIDSDDEVNAMVLTGAGKTFSSGGDIRRWQRALRGEEQRQRWYSVFDQGPLRTQVNLMKPAIAAVNGDAIGWGSNLALQCDIVIMAEDARIGDLHVAMGLVAGDGGFMWSLYVGLNKAKELIMTGELIKGREAERIGLVNHAVPKEEVLPRAIALAERLAKGPIQAIVWNKYCLNKIQQFYGLLTRGEAVALESLCFNLSEDHKEPVDAFLEKRKPNYKGDWVGFI